MKKTTLRQAALKLALLAVALLAPTGLWAQEILTVHDGTETNEYAPFYGWYLDTEGTTSEFIIPEDELSDMVGGSISKLTFYISGSPVSWGNPTIQVYMGEVEGTTLSSTNGPTNFTVVYTGYVSNQTNPMVIEFDEPYVYEGGNLLIGTYVQAAGTYKHTYFFGVSAPSGSSINSYTSWGSASTNPQSFLPKTTFTYEAASTGCDMPTAIAITDGSITTNGATVTWDNSTGSTWNLRYKASTDADYTMVNGLTTNTYTFNSLTQNTAYSVGVQTVCGGTTSSFRSTSFTTADPCGAPTNLQASNITPNSATLSWTPGYQETEWTVKYKKSSEDWNNAQEETVNGTPSITLNGLDGTTTYNVQVYNCENYVSANFTTAAGIPLIEAFAASSAPNGWTRYRTLLTDDVLNGTTSLTTYSSGWYFGTANSVFDNHARLNIYGTNCQYWLVTPTLPMEDNVQLTFDMALTPFGNTSQTTPMDDDKFVVLITTDNGSTWTVLRQWDNAGSQYVYENISSAATGEAVAIDLSSYAGENIAIAFYGESTADGADMNLHIDNVRIDYIPSCAIPTGLTRSNVTAHTADLSWTSDATAWQICVNNDETDLINVTTNPYTLDELAPETAYTVKIRANCSGTYSEWTNAVSFSTGIACPVPTSVTVSDVDGHNATVTWTEAGSATHWDVTYKLSTDDDAVFEENVTTVSTASHTLSGLDPETTYNVIVRAACGGEDGNSQWVTRNFTTTVACPAPTGLATSNITSHGVTLTWTAEEGATFQYNYYKTSEYNAENIAWDNTTTNNTVTLSGLDPETGYTFVLRKDCGSEDGYSQKVTITFTTDVACPAPTNLTVAETNINANGATATWNGTSQSYVVMVGESSISESTVDFEDQAIPASFTNDATHPWTVTANGADGSSYCAIPGNNGVHSSQSDLTCEVTGPCTVSFKAKVSSESGWDKGFFLIDGVEQFNISGTQDWTEYSYVLTAGTHTIIWRYKKDSSGSTGADLFYVDNITMPITVVSSWTEYTTTEQTYTFDNLDPETDYQVKVKGNCGDEGYSQETAPVSFTTWASCPVPSNLDVDANSITAHGATLTWLADNDSYNITIGQLAYLVNANFETGDLSQAAFTNGTHAWSVVDNDHSGAFCARSATGQSSATSSLELTVTVANNETLTFSARVSSESGYDKAYFFIDEVAKINGISGAGNWIDYSFPLTAGTHTLSWQYTKDQSVSSGEDCFYVDDIVITNGISPIGNFTSTTTTYNFTELDPETTYSVQVQGVCGSETTAWSEVYSFTTGIACPAPTNLAFANVTNHTVDLTWNVNGNETTNYVYILNGVQSENDITVTINEGVASYTLQGLSSDNEYTLSVMADCGSTDGFSAASNEVAFITLESCTKPSDIAASVSGNTATITWTGYNDSYNLRYRKPAFFYDFGMATPWIVDAFAPCSTYDGDGISVWGINGVSHPNQQYTGACIAFQNGMDGGNLSSYSGDAFGMMICPVDGSPANDWLILPEITIENGYVLSFMGREITTQYGDEIINIGVYGTTDGTFAETIAEDVAVNSITWAEFSYDLSAYAGQTIRLAINYVSTDIFGFMIDDIFVGDPTVWDATVEDITSTSYDIPNVVSDAGYQVQVQGECTAESESTAWVSGAFNTLTPAFTKEILANKWYAISSPRVNRGEDIMTFTGIENLVSPTTNETDPAFFKYDLYRYDEATGMWENSVEANYNTLEQGRGYIYRRSTDGILSFSGITTSADVNVTASVANSDDMDLLGFNLVGNPFNQQINFGTCYSLEPNGTWLAQENYSPAVAEGIMVRWFEPITPISFSTVAKKSAPAALEGLTFTVSNNEFRDVVYAMFNGEQKLTKIGHLNSNAPALSIPVDGIRYAIANLGSNCESFDMNFRGNDGEYTITLNSKLSNMSYLHLIDRATGNDIDLLRTPTYTFTHSSIEAIADRFLVKMSASIFDNQEGQIARFNGNGWTVQGDGNLQVFDVLGRNVMNVEVNAQSSINNSQFPGTGVYILRLGEKSQKIVVK